MTSSMREGRRLTLFSSALLLVACHPAQSNRPSHATQGSPPPTVASDAAAAKAFLDGVYAHYTAKGKAGFEAFVRNESAIYAPETVKLLVADARALKGDLGAIEVDWICNCQDFTNIVARIAVTSATPSTATATADINDTGETGEHAPAQDRDTFDLVKTNGGWRIYDIHIRGEPLSLRATLTKEIADLSHGPKAAGT